MCVCVVDNVYIQSWRFLTVMMHKQQCYRSAQPLRCCVEYTFHVLALYDDMNTLIVQTCQFLNGQKQHPDCTKSLYNLHTPLPKRPAEYIH